MRKTFWLVVQEAVYHHDVYGPWRTSRAAKIHAQFRAQTDVDDHHEYVVHQVGIDGLGEEVAAYRKDGLMAMCEAMIEDQQRHPPTPGQPIVVDEHYGR